MNQRTRDPDLFKLYVKAMRQKSGDVCLREEVARSHEIDMDRDESDSFALTVLSLEDIPPISKDSVLSLVPPGSRWIQALGWYSYFGLPLAVDKETWWAIGGECVVKHKTRGAYPRLRAFLHRKHNTAEQALLATARLFNPAADYKQVTYVIVKRVVMRFDARTPEEMEKPQSDILVRVAHAYRQRERVMFRTLLLCEQEANPLYFRGEVPPGVDKFLAGCARPLVETFSLVTRMALRFRELV